MDLFSAAWNSKLPKFYAWTFYATRSSRKRRILGGMENYKCLCLPFFRTSSEEPGQGSQGASNYSSGEPMLAKRTMVSAVAETGSGHHQSSEDVQEPAGHFTRRSVAPATSSDDRAEIMQRRFQSQGLSE